MNSVRLLECLIENENKQLDVNAYPFSSFDKAKEVMEKFKSESIKQGRGEDWLAMGGPAEPYDNRIAVKNPDTNEKLFMIIREKTIDEV